MQPTVTNYCLLVLCRVEVVVMAVKTFLQSQLLLEGLCTDDLRP